MSQRWRIGTSLGSAVLLVWGVAACSTGGDDTSVSGVQETEPGGGSTTGGDDRGSASPGDEKSPGEGDGADGGADSGARGGGGTVRDQAAVLESLPGSGGDGCVRVGDRRDVRSGGMAAGPFDEARASFAAQERAGQPASVRLYFVPATGGRELPGLVVTVRDTATGAEAEFEESTVSDADRWTFYDTEVPIPAVGSYEIRAESGRDTGCFRVQFG